jgi:DNA-binding FrmR family transcriptional regulator
MPDEKQAILQRLRTVEGHLHAVHQMLVEDQPCQQVLHQLNAVQCALQAAGCQLLQVEVERCLQAIRDKPDPEQQMQALAHLADLYPFIYKLKGKSYQSLSR